LLPPFIRSSSPFKHFLPFNPTGNTDLLWNSSFEPHLLDECSLILDPFRLINSYLQFEVSFANSITGDYSFKSLVVEEHETNFYFGDSILMISLLILWFFVIHYLWEENYSRWYCESIQKIEDEYECIFQLNSPVSAVHPCGTDFE